jgi:hypothetical protein
MFSFLRGDAKSSVKTVAKKVQPSPRMGSVQYKSVSMTTTGVAKEAATQSKVLTPQRVMLGFGAVARHAPIATPACAPSAARETTCWPVSPKK